MTLQDSMESVKKCQAAKAPITFTVREALLNNDSRNDAFNEISKKLKVFRHTAKKLAFSFLWFPTEETLQNLKNEEEEKTKERAISTATLSVMVQNGISISLPKIVHSGPIYKKVGTVTIKLIEDELYATLKELLAQDAIRDGEFKFSADYAMEELED